MEPNMFCYQCQETAKGTGCILKGVCGKESHTAQAMDLLLFVLEVSLSLPMFCARQIVRSPKK